MARIRSSCICERVVLDQSLVQHQCRHLRCHLSSHYVVSPLLRQNKPTHHTGHTIAPSHETLVARDPVHNTTDAVLLVIRRDNITRDHPLAPLNDVMFKPSVRVDHDNGQCLVTRKVLHVHQVPPHHRRVQVRPRRRRHVSAHSNVTDPQLDISLVGATFITTVPLRDVHRVVIHHDQDHGSR